MILASLERPIVETSTGWCPVLEGELQERALETVVAIHDALRRMTVPHTPALAGGTLGLSVLSAYMHKAGLIEDDGTTERLHEFAVDAGTAMQLNPSLYSGLAGLGWATEHLQDYFGETDVDGICDEVDESLAELLTQSPWTGDYDLIAGLVGYGVYALERLPQPGAITILERVIDRLSETVEEQPDGLTWWTNPNWLMPETREKCPKGYYNLGLAHGVPGVIALLGQACAAGIAVEKARPLLDGAVRWLLAQQPDDGSGFTHCIDPASSEEPKPARLAWCYGDPGIAIALFGAARCVDDAGLECAALAIAHRAAARPLAKAGVKDAGLCHGAVGLGHIFNRLFQATGDEALADTSRFWFGQALTLRRPGRGVAGYSAFQPNRAPGYHWVDSPDLLEGAAGIALALLAATAWVEPNWDRMLMTAIPAQGIRNSSAINQSQPPFFRW
jgi:class I lanthipeptide synthase